jgi:hypothetical protein
MVEKDDGVNAVISLENRSQFDRASGRTWTGDLCGLCEAGARVSASERSGMDETPGLLKMPVVFWTFRQT